MANWIIPLGALNLFIAIGAGAFAAHGLKNVLSPEYLDTFKTAADYQVIHGIGMILIGLLNKHTSSAYNTVAATLMLAGIILFSGSLYALTLTGTKWLGIITPFGGVCFLVSWLIIAYYHLRYSR